MRYFWMVFSVIAILLSSCSGNSSEGRKWMETQGKLHVISTTAMINDLVSAVGGEYIAPYTLIERGLDPHSYQLVKGDDEKLAKADLIFYNGLGLEHGASLQYYLANSNKAISIGGEINAAHPDKVLHVGMQTDPHIWMDASLFSEAIPIIVKALSEKDPQHASDYAAAGAKKKAALDSLHSSIRELLSLIPQDRRYLVTSHDAFNYFTRAYLAQKGEDETAWSKRFQAPEGLAPDSQISSADIQQILKHVINYQIAVIFPESNVSQDSIKKIIDAAREKGFFIHISSQPLYGDSMGKKGSGADTYEKMLLSNAAVLESEWKK